MSDEAQQTTTLSKANDVGSLRPIRILVTDGPDRGREVVVSAGTCILGSSKDCDLVLTEPTVSRQHAALELLGSRVRVKDLGSKNGTRYLGAAIQQVDVPVGAVLELGRSRIALLPPELPPGIASDQIELDGVLGRSLPMRRLFAEVLQVATSEAAVMVVGETGAGKERVARAIHARSARSAGPFRVFDCGAIHPDLLQSALFGHISGAFTGAVQDRVGALEEANGGTLFLDEVSELPLAVQPVLLRALETKTFTRLGEGTARKSDFRIIASTHRDLAEEVATGRFRSDLFFRLSGIVVRVPPLRERFEDIPLLVEQMARELGHEGRLDMGAVASLCARRWPGNVRELRNVVERIIALGPDAIADGESTWKPPADFHEAREQAIGEFEKSYLRSLLAQTQGSVSAAARKAKVARSYFYEMLEKHGLSRKSQR